MKRSLPLASLALVLGLATGGGAAASVPESWWSIPLGDEMQRTVAKDVQTALVNLNCYSGPIDGVIGPRSRQAIRTWQRVNQYPQTGVVSEPLMQTILTQQSVSCPRS
ncbi:peptidoglycan-binding domain-containing protein [Arenibaculum sp.]|jgi:peptidoglycan hydrolase-like protein with peptidoglycan-binding domain|uniref:peptidoglycan-binding domain-containing protein n=1 Tax=Arenibaculum sp. TaxID=2865862 RepID=UPI002E14ADDC|nr:peptidoglycan-binding domain-containing protein [Arenibaculum sp.]